MIRTILKAGVMGAALAALGACSILSTPDPVQLYRFGAMMDEPARAGTTPAPLLISIRRVEFPDASRDERILGVTGTETAYIGGARWVSPAAVLFDDSLNAAFAARPDRIRVLDRREPGTTPLVLRVAVSSFEARYLAGQDAPPTVVVTARAQLRNTPERVRAGGGPIRPEDGRTVEQVFTVSVPARENRVSAIVDAFDAAVRDVNGQVVDWTLTSAPAPLAATSR
ncbi:ABC-type transport auxiliary lipoprotein family protein [Brevundimonas sp. VNH65]|uniref:ABC-type transport auxiliary lipoprotein family protein n=1 Tax=Brevundimonas sp. VNH65 TaxID=3400917 RepID=UPI003C0D2820